MREHDVLCETNLRFRFPELDVSLFDPPSTTLPLVAPSSPNALRDNTTSITTFPDTPYPLTQSTGFGVGEIFSIDVSVDEDNSSCGSDNIPIEEHDHNENFVGRLGVDVVFTVLPSLDHDTICPSIPLTFFMFLLQVHYPSMLLSAMIGHLLILMLCLRGIRSTIMRFQVPLEGITPTSILTICNIYLEKLCSLLPLTILPIFPRHLISLGEHTLSFLDSCFYALAYIHLSCMLRCSIRSCEL